jgi:hypothetical protein
VEFYSNEFFQNTTKGAYINHLRGATILWYNNTYTGPSGFGYNNRLQEEDGPSRFNYKADYPGYDPHRDYFSGNVFNGSTAADGFFFVQPSDGTYCILNTNIFQRMPNSADPAWIYPYTPLAYPHPWRSGTGVSPSVSWAQTNYTVAESATSIALQLQRGQFSSGAISVTVNTSNGSATAGSDYTAISSQVVNWANGDSAAKTVTVTLLPDSLAEGNQNFNVTMSAPTGGAVLSGPATATVTITDDDATRVVPLMGSLSFEAEAGLIEAPLREMFPSQWRQRLLLMAGEPGGGLPYQLLATIRLVLLLPLPRRGPIQCG